MNSDLTNLILSAIAEHKRKPEWTLEVWRGSLDREVGHWETYKHENGNPLTFASELEAAGWEMEHQEEFYRVPTQIVRNPHA